MRSAGAEGNAETRGAARATRGSSGAEGGAAVRPTGATFADSMRATAIGAAAQSVVGQNRPPAREPMTVICVKGLGYRPNTSGSMGAGTGVRNPSRKETAGDWARAGRRFYVELAITAECGMDVFNGATKTVSQQKYSGNGGAMKQQS